MPPTSTVVPEAQWERVRVYVLEIIDGDTLRVRTKTKPEKKFTVQLLGVACPNGKPGLDATRHIAQRILSETVVLQGAARAFNKNNRGATLGYVEYIGVDIGKELVAKNLCGAIPGEHPRRASYLKADALKR